MTYIDRDYEITQEAKEWLQELLTKEGTYSLATPFRFTNDDLGISYVVLKLSLDRQQQIQCEAVDEATQEQAKFSLSRMSSENLLEMVDQYIKG